MIFFLEYDTKSEMMIDIFLVIFLVDFSGTWPVCNIHDLKLDHLLKTSCHI